MSKNTGGPAFPTTKPLDGWGDPNAGMTLRDYFAAKAMQGMLMRGYGNIEHLPVDAYAFADAMIAEREK